MQTTVKFLGQHEEESYKEFALGGRHVLFINKSLMLASTKQNKSHVQQNHTAFFSCLD